MACRFPDAPDPATFWRNQLARRTSFRPVPPERWPQPDLTAELVRDNALKGEPRAAFVDGVDLFAAKHFKIAPRRGEAMDPQQRLALEVVREALQDAGLETRPFDRRRTATFLGVCVSEYQTLSTLAYRLRQLEKGQFGDPLDPQVSLAISKRVKPIRRYSLPGCLLSMCASNVAQQFDFGGPAFTLDAACASSLVALVQAAQYLRTLPPRKEHAPVALAGGAYIQLQPDCMVGFTQVGALSEKDCRPFDRDASGFMMGEGVGVVVLKRLEDALQDGDPVYAVLRGVAWNSDGKGDNPSIPAVHGQLEVLQQGFEDARLDPADVGYFECHGTGTQVGDAVEIEALARLNAGRPDPAWVGAVKANFGHTMGAAGVASFLRAVLAVHHATIPPQANFEAWHPDLERFAEHLRVPTEPQEWRGVRRAGVSSFGFGGSNAFALLEEAPRVARATDAPATLTLSAATPALLQEYARRIAEVLPEHDLPDVAAALAERAPGACTLTVTAATREEAAARLLAGEGADAPALPQRPRRAVTLPFVPLERVRYWILEDRPAAPRAEQLVRELQVDPESPYLRDHVWRGRPLVPLAMALDLVATEAGLRPPFALRDVQVPWAISVRGPVTLRVQREGDRVSLSELRRSGRELVAVEARIAPVPPPPLVQPGAQPLPVQVDLEEFYRSGTFHGPSMQGIHAVLPRRGTEVRGLVRTNGATGVVDVVAVDGAFQLALLGARLEGRKPMLPRAIHEFVLLESFGEGPVEVHVSGEQVSEDEACGRFLFYGRGRLLGWMDGVVGRAV